MHDMERRVAAVRERIARAAASAGRADAEIELLAVSKTRSVAEVTAILDAGVSALGENRVQEAELKIPEVGARPRWHLIGGLQSNKTRRAAALFDVVHSVDRLKLVSRLDAGAAEAGKELEVYAQVEFARTERSLDTVHAEAIEVARAAANAPNLRLAGLMTLPPYDPDPAAARPWFQRLRAIRDELTAEGIDAPGLSMGMSNDFEVAIEEGATIVRVGTALFGPRAQ